MGGVWCKTDRAQPRSFSTKENLNATLSRWTDHVRQAYRKPKTHRPPRPPQKPIRSHERLTISHPTLVKEGSSDGWRTATLIVPEVAPVPPPRKKRKRNRDLTRAAFSMDELNRAGSMNDSTISLPDKYNADAGLESKSQSTILVVTPVLESRQTHLNDEEDDGKENITTVKQKPIEEDEGDVDTTDVADEIIPIEKETMFSSRTLLQSNLGYIDKLSAISEVSTESGYSDVIKSSERSESETSAESTPIEHNMNILAHIHNINHVMQLNEVNKEIREKTAISKQEWLQNILKEESEPYFISRDTSKDLRKGLDNLKSTEKEVDTSEQPNSLPIDHLHLMNLERKPSVVDNGNKTPPPSPTDETPGTNHSVLLELLQQNKLRDHDTSSTSNPFVLKEESIFLTNTKTNIIYKSLSSDNLTNDYDVIGEENVTMQPELSLYRPKEDVLKSVPMNEMNSGLGSTNPFNDPTSKSVLSDYSFQTPKLVESDDGLNSILGGKKSNVVSSFDFKEIVKSQNYVTALKQPQLSGTDPQEVVVNGVHSEPQPSPSPHVRTDINDKDGRPDTKESLAKKESLSSSRRSSITDSLHEFEMSIYDMLKESKKNRDSSDEEESLKTTKTESRQ